MTTPAEFFAEALPWARAASRQIGGVLPSVILAQWADETGFGGPDWSPRNNPGNVGDTQAGGQVVYPTLAAGVTAYVDTMRLPYYAAVRAAIGAHAQATALGESPWAAGHYGAPPGSDLIAILDTYNLTQYDPAPAPAPAPPPLEEATMFAFENSKGQTVIVGKNVHTGNTQVITSNADQHVAGGWGVADVTDAIAAAYPGQNVQLD